MYPGTWSRVPPPHFLLFLFCSSSDEFKGHSLLQAAREADMAKVKKTLALEIINFKHPQTHETALVSSPVTHLPNLWNFNIGVHCCKLSLKKKPSKRSKVFFSPIKIEHLGLER